MKDNNGVFTERLKDARKINRISFRKMAKMLGYKSPSSYMYIERGDVQPTIETINKISEILGQPVEYFFKLNVQESQTK
ncbi:helix-turn-helix transcriptional regulator [Tissierella sp.]|uniref:helix-turn-helix domain-containing protein n=1 Tax=Tissierella sp. TaxID=41274 RepID=UPI003027C982